MTPGSNYNVLSKYEQKVFLSIAESIIPEDGPFPGGGNNPEIIKKMDSFLSKFSRSNQTGVRLMLWLFELLPLFYKFRPFSMLPLKTRIQICEKADRSRFYFRRGPMLIFKMLVMMFFYEQETIERFTGYKNECLKREDDLHK
jgi:hypothetical protein